MTKIILSKEKYFKHLYKNDKKCLDTPCGKVVICLQVIDIRFCLKVKAKSLSAKKVFKRFKHFVRKMTDDMRKQVEAKRRKQDGLLLQISA